MTQYQARQPICGIDGRLVVSEIKQHLIVGGNTEKNRILFESLAPIGI